MIKTLADLYSPPDALEAYDEWSANCGPAALAAILKRPVASVRELFPEFAKKKYVNPTDMMTALHFAGRKFRKTESESIYGLKFVQIDGPWCGKDVPIAAAYKATHWIATATIFDHAPFSEHQHYVYDVNADRWLSKDQWEKRIMPLIVAINAKATGWFIRTRIEVSQREPQKEKR